MIGDIGGKVYGRQRLERRQTVTLLLIAIVSLVGIGTLAMSAADGDAWWKIVVEGFGTALGLFAVYRYQAKHAWRRAGGTGLGLAAVYVLGAGAIAGHHHWMMRAMLGGALVMVFVAGVLREIDR